LLDFVAQLVPRHAFRRKNNPPEQLPASRKRRVRYATPESEFVMDPSAIEHWDPGIAQEHSVLGIVGLRSRDGYIPHIARNTFHTNKPKHIIPNRASEELQNYHPCFPLSKKDQHTTANRPTPADLQMEVCRMNLYASLLYR
jgi:hypothetical protein